MTPGQDNLIELSDEELARLRDIAMKSDGDIAGMIQLAGADTAEFSSFMEEMGSIADPEFIQIYSEMMALENAEPPSFEVRIKSVEVRSLRSSVKLYVGNLPFSATETMIRQAFERVGRVESVALVNDRETGRPRGFGFVSMPVLDAEQAVAKLDGVDFLGRPLKVSVAQEVAHVPRQGELKNN